MKLGGAMCSKRDGFSPAAAWPGGTDVAASAAASWAVEGHSAVAWASDVVDASGGASSGLADVVSLAPSGSGSTAFLTGSSDGGEAEPLDVTVPGTASPEDVAVTWEEGVARGPSLDVDGPGSVTAREQAESSLSRPVNGPLRKYPVNCDESES